MLGFFQVLLLLISSTAVQGKGKFTPPNIVFLLADDLGWNDVGFHGSRQVRTPVIDSLANEGLILNKYYTLPLCTPSRASFMTGKHAIRVGLQHKVIVTGQRLALPLHFKLLPEFLNDLGYESHAVGKWHLGSFHKSYLPTFRGFKTFYGMYYGKADYYNHWESEMGMAGLDWHFDEGKNLSDLHSEYGLYSTRAFAARSEKIIEEHDFKSKPLFLYVPFQAPHSGLDHDPLQVPRDTESQVNETWHIQRRKYLGMLSELDTAVGRIMKSLENKGKEVIENTIVVFSSDNGGAPNGLQQWNWGSNYPLRSSKGHYYEGGLRAVGLVWGKPFEQRRGQVSTEMMHITDWLPTFFEAAVGDKSKAESTLKEYDLDGFSMLDMLTGKNLTSPRSEIVLNFDPLENTKAIRVGRYKYLLNPNNRHDGRLDDWFEAPGESPEVNETLVAGTTPAQIFCEKRPSENVNLKCYSSKSTKLECLYDIENDPCEYFNLIDNDSLQNVKNIMLERIRYWESLQVPAMRPPLDPESDPKHFGYAWQPWTNDPKIPENEVYNCNPQHCIEVSIKSEL